MYEPVLGVLRNFKQLISEFGFIPNGTRKYYSKRSQPPFFGPMVRSDLNQVQIILYPKTIEMTLPL